MLMVVSLVLLLPVIDSEAFAAPNYNLLTSANMKLISQSQDINDQSEKFQFYSDDETSISYPSDWLVEDEPTHEEGSITFVTFYHPYENVSVNIHAYDSTSTSDLNEF